MQKSSVIKRSIIIHGRRTSISVEDSFWQSLKEIAAGGKKTLSDVVGAIERERVEGSNLSSAIRVFVLGHYRTLAATVGERERIPVLIPPPTIRARAADDACVEEHRG